MKTAAIQILLPRIIAAMGMSCGRLSNDSSQRDISEIIAADLRESINPFAADNQINYVRIKIEATASGIGYAINDRPMKLDALDETLGKLAHIDRNQTLVVELGEGATPDTVEPLIALFKKHEFRNVARRGEDNKAIWIME